MYYSLHIMHYILLITHYALCINHYTLCITYYSLHIMHYILLITHYALCINHYTLCITYYSLHIMHYILLIMHYTLINHVKIVPTNLPPSDKINHLIGLSTLFPLDKTCRHKLLVSYSTCLMLAGWVTELGVSSRLTDDLKLPWHFLHQTFEHHTGHWSVWQHAWCWQVTGLFPVKREIMSS